MASTGAFAAEVAQLITQTHEQRMTVQVDVAGPLTLTLDVIDWSIDWDEARTPRVQGQFICAVPESQATLDLIDPRTLVPVHVLPAYRLRSGEWDEHEVAKLYLRKRTVTRRDGDAAMILDVASLEALFIDALAENPTAGDSTYTATDLTAAMRQLVTDAFAGTPLAGTPTDGAVTSPPLTIPTAPHPWDSISDQAEQYDVNIYDNGTGRFTVAPRRTTVADAVLSLSVGANGTITESSTGVTRDDWANWVAVSYIWRTAAGAQLTDGGYANVTAGPFAPASAGYKILTVTKNMKGDNAAGNRLGRTTLRRMLARSRSYSITSVPAWWVRPEDTVTLQLPLGSQERHLVSRVGFTPGSMTIETRLPDTASTITGE